MLENLDTFLTLVEEGTMTRAAARLRVTQSAISKRIRTLERELGEPLLERSGRSFRLSQRGEHIAAFSGPLLAELRSVFHREIVSGRKILSLSVSSGLITSWAPRMLKAVERRLAGVSFDISTYSATVSIERVRSGDHMLALCHGEGVTAHDLVASKIADEEMVIVPSALQPFAFPGSGVLRVIGPEQHSESWLALRKQVSNAERNWRFALEVEKAFVSFAGTVQMAKAGFGHGIVPISVARQLGVSKSKLHRFPKPGLRLPVNIVGRKRLMLSEDVQAVVRAFRDEAKDALE